MSFWCSRETKSDLDYRNFFGMLPDERDIPRVDYKFNAMIAEEINALQPLPSPFAAAYELCKDKGVSQKWYLNSVRMERGDLATDVFSGGLSMPAVLIGNAAHAIPELLSLDDINAAIWDGIDLCKVIVRNYNDDRLFSQISDDNCASKSRSWQRLCAGWEERWLTAHGMPYDLREARSTWVKLARTSRLTEQQTMSPSEFESAIKGDRRALQAYKKRELARWNDIQQKIRARYERKNAMVIPPGVDPTKVVIRYLDSGPQPEETGERKVTQDRRSDRSRFPGPYKGDS